MCEAYLFVANFTKAISSFQAKVGKQQVLYVNRLVIQEAFFSDLEFEFCLILRCLEISTSTSYHSSGLFEQIV